MTLFRLSNLMLNRSKRPSRPRMRGIPFSALRSAVTSKGYRPIFRVILATNTETPCPSMPYDFVRGSLEGSSPSTSASESGSMVKSAPVSSKNRYGMNPEVVLRKTEMCGSEILPRRVGFSESGNLIDAYSISRRDELNFQLGASGVFQDLPCNFSSVSRGNNNPAFVNSNILATVPSLQGEVIGFRYHH